MRLFKKRGEFSLYANDYIGDPAPHLIALANELRTRGIKIQHLNYQRSYSPPNPEETDRAIDNYQKNLQ